VKQQVQYIGISSVDDTLAQYIKNETGIDISLYVGGVIEQINGKNAVSYIVEWSDTSIGLYKDLGTRFNLALTTFFMQRQQSRLDVPDSSTMTFVIRRVDGNRETVTIPWVAMSQVTYSDNAQFQASCLPTTKASYQHQKKPLLSEVTVPDIITVDNNEGITQLVDGEKISYYQIGDNVGVVKIVDFGPSSISQFAKDFQLSLYYAKINRIPKLIVDLTNNGGGEECLGYALVKYMFPNDFAQNYVSLFANSDMIQSSLGTSLAAAGAKYNFTDNIWYPGHWRSTNGQVYSDDSWFQKGISHTRGGSTSEYTSLIKENYCDSFFQYFDFDGGSLQHYLSDNLLLLSNGRCASTCALFSRHLQDSGKAKTVVVGGVYGVEQGISACPGGQVYEFDELMADVDRYNLQSDPHAPKPLPISSRFRFAIREAYSWRPDHSTSPLEFYFEPSDFRLAYTEASALNTTQVWLDTIPFFDICLKWETKPCSVVHGKGVEQCDTNTGKYLDTCNIIQCDAGYGIDKDECQPCGIGTYKNETGTQCISCTKPPNSKFTNSSTLTSDACPFICSNGYVMVKEHTCVKDHVAMWALIGITAPLLCIILLIVSLQAIWFIHRRVTSDKSDESNRLL
jgi:hypothetical protein